MHKAECGALGGKINRNYTTRHKELVSHSDKRVGSGDKISFARPHLLHSDEDEDEEGELHLDKEVGMAH